MTDTLRTDGVSVRYGGVQALLDLDLAVGAGQIVGLIGPNGAGKTTCIDAISGFTPCTGAVILRGADMTARAPHRRARLGLARTWQAADLFDDLTARENMQVSSGHRPWGTTIREVLRGRTDPSGEAERALAQVGLEHLADRGVADLTQGQRKLVGVARALAASPCAVCLDEPAAGLDPDESRELGRRLRSLADGGIAMLLVDHDMSLVLSICDQVIVLDFGRVIARGAPEEVRGDHAVIEAYLGHAAQEVEDVPANGARRLT